MAPVNPLSELALLLVMTTASSLRDFNKIADETVTSTGNAACLNFDCNKAKEKEDRPVQVSSKIPEARLSPESSIDQDVKSTDAEKSRISLSAWENVESRMAESDVANDVRRFQEMIQRHCW